MTAQRLRLAGPTVEPSATVWYGDDGRDGHGENAGAVYVTVGTGCDDVAPRVDGIPLYGTGI